MVLLSFNWVSSALAGVGEGGGGGARGFLPPSHCCLREHLFTAGAPQSCSAAEITQ